MTNQRTLGQATACVTDFHRGANIAAKVSCQSCGGSVNVPAYDYIKHGDQCVKLRCPVDESVQWCLSGCKDHQKRPPH